MRRILHRRADWTYAKAWLKREMEKS